MHVVSDVQRRARRQQGASRRRVAVKSRPVERRQSAAIDGESRPSDRQHPFHGVAIAKLRRRDDPGDVGRLQRAHDVGRAASSGRTRSLRRARTQSSGSRVVAGLPEQLVDVVVAELPRDVCAVFCPRASRCRSCRRPGVPHREPGRVHARADGAGSRRGARATAVSPSAAPSRIGGRRGTRGTAPPPGGRGPCTAPASTRDRRRARRFRAVVEQERRDLDVAARAAASARRRRARARRRDPRRPAPSMSRRLSFAAAVGSSRAPRSIR